MRYHNITKDDMVNGEGLRVVLWVSGCLHHCKGCQNPITWDPDSGLIFDNNAKNELFDELKKDYISGITFSGGDPLFAKNRPEIEQLAKEIKERFPSKNIWLYTGYPWETIENLPLLNYIDVVVDGQFIERLADVSYHWAGSTNQRIIDVQASLKNGELIKYKER